MKQRLPYLAFAVTLVLFLFMVWHYAADAPAKMVGHFNEAGKPSGKMPSDEFFAWMLGIGLSIPLILIVLLYPIRFMSPKLLNSPHPEYWRKPENFRRACDFIFRTSFWFSAAFLVWTTGLLCLVVAANQELPPRLNGCADSAVDCRKHSLDYVSSSVFHADTTRRGQVVNGEGVLRRCPRWAKD